MERIDKTDPAVECGAMFNGRTDFHLLADPHVRDFIFKNIDLHPDPGEIGNIEKHFTRVDVLPLLDHLFNDDTGERRVDRQADIRLAGLFQCSDLALLDTEQHQALFGRRHQPFAILGDGGDRRIFQLVAAFDCQQVLLLGSHQIGRIDFSHRLVFADMGPHGADIELVDTPGDPGGNLGLARLIVLYGADGVDLLVQDAVFRFNRGDIGHDPLVRRHGHMTQHLGLLFLLRSLSAAIRGRIDLLDQLHAADRAGARFVLDDEGVHGTGVELLALDRLALANVIVTLMLPRKPAATR